jgi:superfamily II DNA or RNA helicase
MKKKLMRVTYCDPSAKIRVTARADIVVCGKRNGRNILCAVRMGGYPEQTEAVARAICAGATVEIEANGKLFSFATLAKGYRKRVRRDGIYAEAVLLAESASVPEKDAKKKSKKPGAVSEAEEYAPAESGHESAPREAYLYVPRGDETALFEATDRETIVPLIPVFREYLLGELKKSGALKPLGILSAVPVSFEAWVLKFDKGDANITRIAERGLGEGAIAIPGTERAKSVVPADEIANMTCYLARYGKATAEHIKSRFEPLFDPEKDCVSPEIAATNETIAKNTGYRLFGAQLAAAEAAKRRLAHDKAVLIVAECGSGKTKIGVAALRAALSGKGKGKTFVVVLCPSHITKKWVREIAESTDDSFSSVVKSPAEFDALCGKYEKGDKSCFAVMSKETARDGYMRAPAVLYGKSRSAFVCPDCGGTVEMSVSGDSDSYTVPAEQFFFRTETKANHKCAHCGSILWTAQNPNAKEGLWAKIADYGFVYVPKAREHLSKTKNPSLLKKIRDVAEGRAVTVGAHRKYPLSTYIKKKYKGRIHGLIADELHQYNNNSGQGDAMGELFGAAKKAIGMTATLINGYAGGIFHLLYRLMPGLMEEDGQKHDAPSAFESEYGVTENTYEVAEGDYSAKRRTVMRKKKSSRRLPGVSPLVYTKFLLERAVFLSLSDMGKDLPEYEEIPVALTLPSDVAEVYGRMRDVLVRFMKEHKKAARKILSAYLNLLISYPDKPCGQEAITDPSDGLPIVTPPDLRDADALLPKDESVLEITERKLRAGENVLICTNWVRLGTAEKLLGRFTEAGTFADILYAKVKPADREAWVAERVEKGLRVLIANPAIVETGLDLNAFTTLIFYDTGTKLFTMRQAARRSFRINQSAPRIEVYLLYYRDTLQHKLLKLMGTKLAAATLIEGGFSEEGLAAMSAGCDMMTLMAKELMLGIKDSIEDVSDMFKRMAFTWKSDVAKEKDVFATPFTSVENAAEIVPALPVLPEFTFRPDDEKPAGLPLRTKPRAEKPGPGMGKRGFHDMNQYTFFDLSDNIA